jgi:hypothetical protein
MSSLVFTLSAISNEKALLLFKAIIQSETNNDDDDDDDDGRRTRTWHGNDGRPSSYWWMALKARYPILPM